MINVLEYLEQSAEKYPGKTAFSGEGVSCTYLELMQRAKRIGTSLKKNAVLGSPVAVLMEKSVDAIAAFMGVAYAGCFYVMLDVKQPSQRLISILEILESPWVITSKEFEGVADGLKIESKLLKIEDLEKDQAKEAVLEEIRRRVVDTAPLYGIFTSGSTGVPKGVVVSHRSVIDFIDCFTGLFDISPEDTIGNQAPFDFDVSVKDIYSTLKTGATMEIIPRKMFSFPMQLLDLLEEKKITTLIWAVSALCMVSQLNGFDYKVPQSVNKILFSGEVMPVKQLNMWQRYLPSAVYVNLYGPTEITCNCTYYILNRKFQLGEVIPIGVPFPNEKVFLLGEHNEAVTKAQSKGEICVAGTALSLGYYNNPEQTRQAYVQNPLNHSYLETIYRTGDLGYYNDLGELCYSTRKDFQIKHMGHRIELGEIEAALEKVEEITRVCCIFDEKASKIIAFYEGGIEKRELVKGLRKSLPAFMIPNSFHQVAQLPITKNGKIDRAGLKNVYQEGGV